MNYINIFDLKQLNWGKLLVLFCLFSAKLAAQKKLEGKVLDAKTKQALAFVSIAAVESKFSTTSSIEGKFLLNYSKKGERIVFSYVGYQSLNIVADSINAIVYLIPKPVDLSVIEVLPTDNPAHRIILLATKNRSINNPENIPYYSCKTYSKTYYDFVMDNTNEAKKGSTAETKQESELKTMLKDGHTLMLESETARKYLYKNLLNEKVLATKVSGFKQANFSTSATDVQPFSFYEDYFKMLGKNYLNPLATGSTTKYFFLIEDTLFQHNDTVFIISFRPLKNKNFDGLKGMLYINSNLYALQNVIASPYDEQLIEMKIQQQYAYVANKYWFPEQLTYEMYLKKYPSEQMGTKLYGKTFISSIDFEKVLYKKDFDVETLKMSDDANSKNEDYWQKVRHDSLDAKEKQTYRILDSLGKAEHFDKKLKLLESLFTFKLPLSIFDLDLNRIVALNDYEDVRLGVGFHTNNKLSKWMNVGAYYGYGIKDKTIKYGADASIMFKRNSKENFIKYIYLNDILEPAQTRALYTRKNYYRNLISYRMDYMEQQQLEINFRAMRYFLFNLAASKTLLIPTYPYIYIADTNDRSQHSTRFEISEVRLKGKFAFKEKLVQSLGQLISGGSAYPVIYFSIAKGLKIPQWGNYDYSKISVGIEHLFLIRNVGKTKFLLEAGMINGNVPYPLLFNGNGAYSKSSYVYVENCFQTMRLYEFVSDSYVNLFFTHNFGSLLFKRKNFKPELIISSAAAYGSLANKAQHLIEVTTLEKGFFESGVFVNNLLRKNYFNICYLGLGGGVFYRYGAYSLPDNADNFAYKISLTFSF